MYYQYMYLKKISSFVAMVSLLLSGLSITAYSESIELPELGSSSALTQKEEQRIGAAWLKQYRRQAPTLSVPIINDYVETLIEKLAKHSSLNDMPLSLVVTNNTTLNAFAVPGGIIGIHTGLLNYAKTEQQFASVIAHELAHLSQRHYARGVQKQKGQTLTVMAGLLAGLLLAANSDGEGGLAALSTTQAFAVSQQLRFSRGFEREADRLGMEIMAKSGMNPHATEEMFSEMDRASRFSSRPPEFLLTHPLTSNRVVDAINYARKYPKQSFPENINYQFIRAQAILLMETSKQQAINRFKSELTGFDSSPDGSRYGLALAMIENKQFSEAKELLVQLQKRYTDNAILNIAYSHLLAAQGKTDAAIKYLSPLAKQKTDYYPYAFELSRLHYQKRNYPETIAILNKLSKQREDDPLIWHDLAEVSGLQGNIPLLRKARAEYFILYGNFDNAEQQLQLLIKSEKNKNSEFYLYADNRLKELSSLRKLAQL